PHPWKSAPADRARAQEVRLQHARPRPLRHAARLHPRRGAPARLGRGAGRVLPLGGGLHRGLGKMHRRHLMTIVALACALTAAALPAQAVEPPHPLQTHAKEPNLRGPNEGGPDLIPLDIATLEFGEGAIGALGRGPGASSEIVLGLVGARAELPGLL